MIKQRFDSSTLSSQQWPIGLTGSTRLTATLAEIKNPPLWIEPSESLCWILSQLEPDPAIETLLTLQKYSEEFVNERIGTYQLAITVALKS